MPFSVSLATMRVAVPPVPVSDKQTVGVIGVIGPSQKEEPPPAIPRGMVQSAGVPRAARCPARDRTGSVEGILAGDSSVVAVACTARAVIGVIGR